MQKDVLEFLPLCGSPHTYQEFFALVHDLARIIYFISKHIYCKMQENFSRYENRILILKFDP